jgi:hypothetical protein
MIGNTDDHRVPLLNKRKAQESDDEESESESASDEEDRSKARKKLPAQLAIGN